jgi:hypothetical protein
MTALEFLSFPEEVVAVLKELATLKGMAYGEIALVADNIIRQSEMPQFDSRVAELRAQLLDPSTDFVELSSSPTLSAGVDVLATSSTTMPL